MGCIFRVSAPEDRIVISTLQRMYRHFYIRLCDIADNGRLVDEGLVDFVRLQALGTASGLWEGIATYLRIISEYLQAYRGYGVVLPSSCDPAQPNLAWINAAFERISCGCPYCPIRSIYMQRS